MASSSTTRLLRLVLLSMVAFVLAKRDTPFRRLQEASQEGTTTTPPSKDKEARRDRRMARALEVVGTPGNLAFLQSAQKDGVDPLEMFHTVVNSDVFQPLLHPDNVEVQHKLLEALPQLAAFPVFKNVMNRQASAEETSKAFAEGLQTVLEFSKTMTPKMKDPNEIFNSMEKIAKSDDPEVKDLYARASTDEDAFDAVAKMVMADYMPGVDGEVLKNIRDSANFDTLLSFPELADFIDQDPYISGVIREGRGDQS